MSYLEKKARIFSNTEGNQSSKSMREVEYDTGRYVGFLAGFKDCQKEYEEKLRWIPVEEKLPEKQGHYLVKAPKSFPKNCIVVVAEFYKDNNTFYSESSDCPIEDATHWRFL